MTDQQLDAYLDRLEARGWHVVRRAGGDVTLNAEFARRHPRIPESYMRFLRRVTECANADETVWFLCADDYNGTSASAWAWNEMEQMTLDGSARDERTRAETMVFWKEHLPFMYAVGGDYAYLALRVGARAFGSVVDGYDIDLTSVSDVAPSFDEFVRLHSAALEGDFGDTVLHTYV